MPNNFYDLLKSPHSMPTFCKVIDNFIQSYLNRHSILRNVFPPFSMEVLKTINPNVRPCFDIKSNTYVELYTGVNDPTIHISNKDKAVPPLIGLRKTFDINPTSIMNENVNENLCLQMIDEEKKVFNSFIQHLFTKCKNEKIFDVISNYNFLFVNNDYCEKEYGTMTLLDTTIAFAKVDFLEPNEFFAVKNFYGHLAIQNSECVIDYNPSTFSDKQVIYVEMIGLLFGAESVCKLVDLKTFETRQLNKFNYMMMGDD